jgi:hypothetical protein
MMTVPVTGAKGHQGTSVVCGGWPPPHADCPRRRPLHLYVGPGADHSSLAPSLREPPPERSRFVRLSRVYVPVMFERAHLGCGIRPTEA